jgi:hypothetical protein
LRISVLLVLVSGCSAIDDFGKFTVAGSDMAGGGCTPSCNCVPANAALGVPDHCAIVPSNSFTCTVGGPTVMLTGGDYTVDTGASPPTFGKPSDNIPNGTVQGPDAVFCFGSLVTSGPSRLNVTGNRPLIIVADSVVRFSGSIILGGGYAGDDKGATGTAGGTNGGDSETAGVGAFAGHAGVTGGGNNPGPGGGGGGNASTGAVGGPAMGGTATMGGMSNNQGIYGSGGGGGGHGSTLGGGGGGGAGILQISAGWEIAFDQVSVDASGGGGAGGAAPMPGNGSPGGGAGGAGGGVFLESPTVTVNGGCISVIGGPGGGGAGATRGDNSHRALVCPFIGGPGLGAAGAGNGGAPGTGMPGGGMGTGMAGGGGGTGGYGHAIIRSHMPPATANVVPMQAYEMHTLP